MKKKQYNLFNKIRAALRDIYRYSPMRKEAIKAVTKEHAGNKYFRCPICFNDMFIQMADVDHEPPLGPLDNFGLENITGRRQIQSSLASWAQRLFFGDVQVICKLCHKKKTAAQRRVRANKT